MVPYCLKTLPRTVDKPKSSKIWQRCLDLFAKNVTPTRSECHGLEADLQKGSYGKRLERAQATRQTVHKHYDTFLQKHMWNASILCSGI